jgi:hypothetical protein
MQPMLTFNPIRRLVYVNAAVLKLLPETDYALFLISSDEKRLNIYPCGANARDAVRLRSGGLNKSKPHHSRFLTDFGDKLLELMKWQSNCKYRLRGALALSNSDAILSFDLTSAEVLSYVA